MTWLERSVQESDDPYVHQSCCIWRAAGSPKEPLEHENHISKAWEAVEVDINRLGGHEISTPVELPSPTGVNVASKSISHCPRLGLFIASQVLVLSKGTHPARENIAVIMEYCFHVSRLMLSAPTIHFVI